jgi:CRP-like cAMP-binding protein
MSLDSDIALLKRVPLFADLPTEQMRLLAFSAVRLDLAQDQVLFREGAKAGSGFVVSSGGLQLSVGSGTRKKVVADCEAGALIGEMALLIETTRPCTATAMVSSQVLELDRKLILRMLNEYPQIAERLRTLLSERLVATVSELGKVRAALNDIERRGRVRR